MRNANFQSFLPEQVSGQITLKEAELNQLNQFYIYLNSDSLEKDVLRINALKPEYVALQIQIRTEKDKNDYHKHLLKIKNLKAIWFEANDDAFLTDDWANLEDLESISLKWSTLNAIPEFLLKLPNLENLDLGYRTFKRFPRPLWLISNFQLLDELYPKLKNKPYPLFLGETGVLESEKSQLPTLKDFEELDKLGENLLQLKTKFNELLTDVESSNSPFYLDRSLKHLATIVSEELDSQIGKCKGSDFPIFKNEDISGAINFNQIWDIDDFIYWTKRIFRLNNQMVDFSIYDISLLQNLFLTREEKNIDLALTMLKGMEGIPSGMESLLIGVVLYIDCPRLLEIEVSKLIQKCLPKQIWRFCEDYIYENDLEVEKLQKSSIHRLLQFFIPFNINESKIWEYLLFKDNSDELYLLVDLEKKEKLPSLIQKLDNKQSLNITINCLNNGNILPILNDLQHLEEIGCLELNSVDEKTLFLTEGTMQTRIPSLVIRNFSDVKFENGNVTFPSVVNLSIKKTRGLVWTGFPKLKTLHIENCLQKSLDFSGLEHQLTKLSIYQTDWQKGWGSQIGALTLLENISIRKAKLKTFPSELSKLKKVEWLNLEYNELTEVPNWLPQIGPLRYLSINYNQIKIIPKFDTSLDHLVDFLAEKNQIQSVDCDFTTMPKLSRLILKNNQILIFFNKFLPDSKLSMLDLSQNKIGYFPSQLLALPVLSNLSAANNEINRLVAEDIRTILIEKHITVSLNNNQLTDLPAIRYLKLKNEAGKGSLSLIGNSIPSEKQMEYSKWFGNSVRF